MRKHFLGILIGLLTFALGVIVLYFSGFSDFFGYSRVNFGDTVVNIDTVSSPIENSGCSNLTSFPGRSRAISDLKKGKNGLFASEDYRDDLVNDWYGKQLRAMREKSLLDGNVDAAEKYRFLWLRTFHHPIYVRIENEHDEIRLSTKELDGAGGYEPGKIIRSRDITLDPKAWCEFLSRLDGASYWRLPKDNDEIGNDGSQWVLEGVKNGRYHIVDRWTPREGEYREACIYLLRLSGLDVDALKDDLY